MTNTIIKFTENTNKLMSLQEKTHEILQEIAETYKEYPEGDAIIMNLSNISRDLNKLVLNSITKIEEHEENED